MIRPVNESCVEYMYSQKVYIDVCSNPDPRGMGGPQWVHVHVQGSTLLLYNPLLRLQRSRVECKPLGSEDVLLYMFLQCNLRYKISILIVQTARLSPPSATNPLYNYRASESFLSLIFLNNLLI